MSCSSSNSSSSKSITTNNHSTAESMGARRSSSEGASRILWCSGGGCGRWLGPHPVTLPCGNSVCGECAAQAMRAASVASVAGRAGVTQAGGCGEPGCAPSDSSSVSNPFNSFNSVRPSPAESSDSSTASTTSAPPTSASTPTPTSSEAPGTGDASTQESEASQFAVLPQSAIEPPHVFPCPSMKCQRGVHQTAPGMGLGRLATDVVVATLLATTMSLADSGSPFDPELFRGDVECALCCNVFVQPVSCPCGHSFCRACVVSARSKCKPQCPVCRAAIPPISYFLRRPQTAITAVFAEWVSNCSSPQPQQQQQPQYTQPPATQPSRSPSSASISSPTLAPQLPPKVMLKPNQHIIPIFLGPKAVLPGVPCFMQFFEQRYKDMIAKIQEINKEGGRGWRSSDSDSENNDCELGLMFGVCIIDDEAMARQNAAARMPAVAAPTSGSSNPSTTTSTTTAPSTGLKRNHAGEQTRATSAPSSNAAADYTRLMNGGCEPVGSAGAPLLKSVLNSSNSHLSPWVVSSIRPGSSSVYLEYGTALKLRSICPIYEEPEGPPPTTHTNESSSGRAGAASSSNSNRSTHSDDDEGNDVEMDENEQPRGSESETELTATNEFQSQTQRRRRRRRSSPVVVKPPAAVARYLVDGIGSWRFKVIERAICEGGLNIALVEYIDDLDFEDEAPCTLDLPETAGEAEAAKSASLDEDAETKTLSDICTVVGCDCAFSRSQSTHSNSGHDSCRSSIDSGAPIPSFPIPKATSGRKSVLSSIMDYDPSYTCPMSEFFKRTRLSSFAKCVYSGVQMFSCTKQPPFPFDLTPPTSSSATHESSSAASIAHTAKQRLLSQTKQQERLQRLYARIAKIVTQILHIVTTSNLVRTNPNALTHFKLIHGAVPTTPTLLSFWLANLLNVTERAKYELLRDDVGGVVGRFEFILAIVQKGRRMVDAAVMAEAYAKATAAAAARAEAESRVQTAGSEENENPDKMDVNEKKEVEVQKENAGFDEMELQALKRVLRFMI
ncbi:LON peptidase N-terminal domain and RING finger protein 3 [Chytriomyces hyalinus]|nr:LON peptidase N-terminal domain and RING finger protein 3 [Chytriomyces hyalinus]